MRSSFTSQDSDISRILLVSRLYHRTYKYISDMHFIKTLATVATISVTAECLSGSILPLRRRVNKQSNPAPITATEYGTIFDVEVQFGNQSFMLLVDSGSSDTWVVQTGFQCINSSNNAVQPQSECGYGSSYNPTSTFRPIKNQTFGVQYGTGIAMGIMGYEDLTIGGIAVTNQTVGIVTSIDDLGDGLQSGLLGLAYPSLTSAHPGTNYPNDSLITDRIIYNPLFYSMYERGLVEPWFSMALDRLPPNSTSGAGGYLGLGELPPVAHSDDWAKVPVEITKAIPDSYYPDGKPVRAYWTVTVDIVTWGPAKGSSPSPLSIANTTTNLTAFQAVVDSGNPLNLFPEEIARSINNAFEPPAVYDEEIQSFVVDCDARPPAYGVTIGDKTFWHDQRDMVIQAGDGVCITGISATTEALGIAVNFLGDTFLKNVVSVFDVGQDEMRFAARRHEWNSIGNNDMR